MGANRERLRVRPQQPADPNCLVPHHMMGRKEEAMRIEQHEMMENLARLERQAAIKRLTPKDAAQILTAEGFIRWTEGEELRQQDFKS